MHKRQKNLRNEWAPKWFYLENHNFKERNEHNWFYNMRRKERRQKRKTALNLISWKQVPTFSIHRRQIKQWWDVLSSTWSLRSMEVSGGIQKSFWTNLPPQAKKKGLQLFTAVLTERKMSVDSSCNTSIIGKESPDDVKNLRPNFSLSGQVISFYKSQIFVSQILPQLPSIPFTPNIPIAAHIGKYLGVSLNIVSRKKVILLSIVEKFQFKY